MRKTKIVCTIGPASDERETLGRMMDAGMNVARLNFSHGTQEEQGAKIKLIRELAAEKGLPVAILQDLAGPKIRTGAFACGGVDLKPGDKFTLTAREVEGNQEEVGVKDRQLPEDVRAGDTLLLADGALEFKVEEVSGPDIVCRVVLGGRLSSHKGINLPSRSIRAPILTKKDYDDLAFGLAQGVDYVALSFVRSAEDIEVARAYMRAQGRVVPIIAKIEKHEALKDIDRIIAAVDGIMVARGDLGVDIPQEKVPTAQRTIIEKANLAAKPVITATQMLKSMTDAPRPTRAEVADVTNAVLEGTDAVMLSEESAAGHYPVESVATMARIAQEAENGFAVDEWQDKLARIPNRRPTDPLARAARGLAESLQARALSTTTETRRTACLAATKRSPQPILAATSDETVFRRLALVRGVQPMLIEEVNRLTLLFEQLHIAAKASGEVVEGDSVVVTAGFPVGQAGVTNLIKLETIA